MEKVIIRDVEEPEKTEIHTKIENTKEGLKKLARFFSLLVSDYNTNNIYCDEHNKIMSVEINSERFWLPLDISYDEENIIVSGIRAISSIPVAKLRKQCLLNYMETIYRFSKNDYGRTLAILVYKNMSEKRRKSKNGKELREYLEEYATEIIRWHVENAEPEEVYTVLKLNLVSADVLQAIYSELEKDMGIEVKAYFLEMIGKESSINASKEEKWTL